MAYPLKFEVERPHPVRQDTGRFQRPAFPGQLHRKAGRSNREIRHSRKKKLARCCAAQFNRHSLNALTVKILEPRHRTVLHIGDVLIGGILAVFSCLGKVGMGCQPLLGIGAIVPPNAILAPQITGDAGLIPAFALERPAVQAAGGHLRLPKAAVRRALQLFRAGLPGVGVAVRLPMVEDVPLFPNVQQSAVGVS